MSHPILDLHCDLLLYLAWEEGRTPYMAESRCSHPQLISGGVKFQTVAIATTTSRNPVPSTFKQVSCYKDLLTLHSEHFAPFSGDFSSKKIELIPAIENAAGLASEEESIDNALSRLQTILDTVGPIFYISLTWNGENRFGGGAGASCGLKEDGKTLLQWLKGKNIAIDFSHASDKLAYDILEYNDAYSLDLSFMASHSNFRAVTNHQRNLPEELVKELIRRKGIIGLNFILPFFGAVDILPQHIEYALKLGAEKTLALGGDFFSDKDLASDPSGVSFFSDAYPNASCYPAFFSVLTHQLQLPPHLIINLAHVNALSFLNRHLA